jgi:metal-responsive CopG/Arc/MetJ family transcriptional regulator
MSSKRRGRNKRKHAVMPRTSVSFPAEILKTLEDLATQKKVSIGWVVRDAVDKYIAEQSALVMNVKGRQP